MVLEDADDIILPEGGSNGLALFFCQSGTSMVVIHALLSIKVARVYCMVNFDNTSPASPNTALQFTLREHLHGLPKRTPGLAIYAMRMSSCPDVGTSFVHLGVDHESGRVDHGLVSALYDKSIAIDENQVRCLHRAEVCGIRVEPQMIREDGILRAPY